MRKRSEFKLRLGMESVAHLLDLKRSERSGVCDARTEDGWMNNERAGVGDS